MTRNTVSSCNTHTSIRDFNTRFLMPVTPVKKDASPCERGINKALVNLQVPLV